MEQWTSKNGDIIRTVFSKTFHFYLIICPHAFCFQYSIDSIGHTFYKLDAHIPVNLIPFSLNALPQFDHPARWTFILIELSLQRRPEMLDRIEVWRLWWAL